MINKAFVFLLPILTFCQTFQVDSESSITIQRIKKLNKEIANNISEALNLDTKKNHAI
tara:strand:+ start:151 stop:324 length:174 start_codon:yes stop_codon:yes gene_type:complete